MLRTGALVCALMLEVAAAEAQVPATPPPEGHPSMGVPTYWVMMVSGEKDGVPWLKTTTPETLGGTVKNTGAWTCTYPATVRGTWEGTAFEQNEVACAIGEQWVRSELQTLNLRRKGDAKSTITVSIRCDVDGAFAAD
jgi:hypothetical protein